MGKATVNISELVGTRYFAYHKYKDAPNGDDFISKKDELIKNLGQIHEQMMGRLKETSVRSTAKDLEKILNDYYATLSGNKDDYNKIMTKLAKRVLESTKDIKIDENINVIMSNTSSLKTKWQKMYDKYRDLLGKDVKSEVIENQPEVKEAKGRWMASYNKLNTARGQLFEGFIQMVVPYVQANMSEIGQEKIDEITKAINEDILSSNKSIRTIGSDSRTVEISFGKNSWEFKTQGKTDVSIPVKDTENAEFFEYNISAKNYSKARDISLVDSASVLGLVSSWNMIDTHTKNFYLSALTYYTKNPRDSFLNAGERLFIIQALVGTTWGEKWSDYLIVNNRSSKSTPIKVVSTADLLSEAAFKGNKINPEEFELKYDPSRQLFAKADGRTPKKMDEKLSALNLSIKMKSKFFNTIYGQIK